MPDEPHHDDHHGVLDLFGRDLLAKSERARKRWISRALQYWRQRGFPYPTITRPELEREYSLLHQVEGHRILRGNIACASMVGLRLANHFHPQMWSICTRGRSPLDCFNDDGILCETLEKCIHFWPNRRCWNAQCVRSAIRISNRARVSNFRPAVAKVLCEQYSANGQTVLDFCAGFGGRLLGCLALRRHYIGIDAAPLQVRGLRRMMRSLDSLAEGTAEIHRACAEDFMCDLPQRFADLIFSSPPYYNCEKYDGRPTQSYLRYPTYAQWKDQFLAAVIKQSARILRPHGVLALNVKNLVRYRIAKDAKELAHTHFRLIRTIWMNTNRLPHDRYNHTSRKSTEPILLFARRHRRAR